MSGVGSRLSARVTIEQPQGSDDGYGGQTISWSAVATVFAEVEPISQTLRERVLADQVKAVAGYRVRLRYRDDVDASMRLQWKTHTLQIHALHEKGGLLELLTYEEQL